MAEPWKNYQTPESGPWDRFKAPALPTPALTPTEKAYGGLEYAKDIAKQVGGGALDAVGYTIRGAGEAGRETGELASKALEAVTGKKLDVVNPFKAPAMFVEGLGKKLKDSTSEQGKQRMEASTPGGDFTDPSSWTAGQDPSVSGYGLHTANVVGQVAPILGAAYATRGKSLAAQLGSSAGISALLGGGSLSGEEGGRIRDMDTQALAGVPLFQTLTQGGMDAEQAREQVALAAEKGAFRAGAPVSAVSGLLLGGILSNAGQAALRTGLQKTLGQKAADSMLARMAAGGLIEAPLEGAQEVAETVAARAGAGAMTGEERDLTENTFADFALGALGGAAVGGGAPLFESGQTQTKPPPAGSLEETADLVQNPQAPLLGLPSPQALAAREARDAADLGVVEVGPDGTATTEPQREQQLHDEFAFAARRAEAGLTPDVNRARAQHPAAAPNLPFPDAAPGSLSDVANVLPENIFDKNAGIPIAGEIHNPGDKYNPFTGEKITDAQGKPAKPLSDDDQVKAAIHNAFNSGQGFDSSRMIAAFPDLTPSKLNQLVKQVTQERRNGLTKPATLQAQEEQAAQQDTPKAPTLDKAKQRESLPVLEGRTQERDLANITLDAEQAKAERQKQRELDQVQADSVVPAAEFTAERNDRIRNAAGLNEDQPTAMAQALEAAKAKRNQPAKTQSNPASNAAPDRAQSAAASTVQTDRAQPPRADETSQPASLAAPSLVNPPASESPVQASRPSATESSVPAQTAEQATVSPVEADSGIPASPTPVATGQSVESVPSPDSNAVYDESPEQLDDDITPPSGLPFENRSAAESMAKRTGNGAKVFTLDDGTFVVRTPKEPSNGLSQPAAESASTPVASERDLRAAPTAPVDAARPGGIAAEATAPGTARPSSPEAVGRFANADELKAARDVVENGAFSKVITTKKDGRFTKVFHNGKQIASVSGRITRKELLKAIDENIKSEQANVSPPGTEEVRADPSAAKIRKLRKQADTLVKDAMAMLDRIPAGQPIQSTRDRNLRERSAEKMRQAAELEKQAEALESAQPTAADSAKPKQEQANVRPEETQESAKRQDARQEGQALLGAPKSETPEQAEPAEPDRRTHPQERAAIDALPKDERDAEIARLREQNAELQKQLDTDSLTGTKSREAYVRDAPSEKRKNKTHIKGVAFLDLIAFKGYNTKFTESGGDVILEAFGRVLVEVGGEAAYRKGGDEFAFLSDQSPEHAAELAAKAQEAMANVRLELIDKDGTEYLLEGIPFRVGVGVTDEAATRDNQRKKLEGDRLDNPNVRPKDDLGQTAERPAEREADNAAERGSDQAQDEVAEGDRVTFTPSKEQGDRYANAEGKAEPISGVVVAIDKTSGGNLRVRIRTDQDAAQGGGKLERTVYSQDGGFRNETERARREALAAGTVKDKFNALRRTFNEEPINNTIHAINQVLGKKSTDKNDFWSLWSDFLGSRELGKKSFDEIVQWMQGAIKNVEWRDDALPRGDRSISKDATAQFYRGELEKHERENKAFDLHREKWETRIAQLENLGGNPEAIEKARKTLAHMAKVTSKNRAELEDGLKKAEAREKEQRAAEEAKTAARLRSIDPKELRQKPTPASVDGWFPVTYKGKEVWSNGHLVDLDGVPHLKGWADRKNPLRYQDDESKRPDVQQLIPSGDGIEAKPIAILDPDPDKKRSEQRQTTRVYFQAGDKVIALDPFYVRYFLSKEPKSVFKDHGKDGAVSVWNGKRLVGLVMPVRIKGEFDTLAKLSEGLDKGRQARGENRDNLSATPGPASSVERLKNYGWEAVKLADAYDFDQLNELRTQVEKQHANPRGEDGGYTENGSPTLYLYDREGRRKLDKLAWAVTYKLQESRAERESMAKKIAQDAPPPSPPVVTAPTPRAIATTPQQTPAAAPEPVKMTMAEWKSVHKDFKGTIDGQRTMLKGGRIVPVEIIKEPATPAPVEPPTEAAASDVSTLAGQGDLMAKADDGQATLAELKAGFESLVQGKDAIKAELSKFTIADLTKRWRGFGRPDTKKSDLVDSLYTQMLGAYNFTSRGISYSPFGGNHVKSYTDAVRKLLDETTDADLQAHAEAVTKAKAKQIERAEKVIEAVKDPKTYEDFAMVINAKRQEGMTFKEARATLTLEQRMKLDELMAEKSRNERRAQKTEQKTEVRTAGNTTASEVIETKHTKLGHDLFVIQLSDRLSTEDYRTLLESAKRLGGNYSSYRGHGAVPGFQFRTRANAEAFRALVEGDTSAAKEIAQARRDAFQDDKAQSAVERLKEMADRLEERADESLNRDRKANTDRRARMAASAEASARADKAMAETMRKIAAAIESGDAKMLDQVRTKTQVEFLANVLRSAKYEEVRQTKQKDDNAIHAPATNETVEYAEWPTYTQFRSDWAKLGRQLLNTNGTKMLGQKLLKLADDVTKEYTKFAKKPENYFKLSTFSTTTGQRPKFTSITDAEQTILRSKYKGQAIPLKLGNRDYTIIMSPSLAKERGIWDGDPDQRITIPSSLGAELVEKLGKVNRKASRLERIDLPWFVEAVHDRLAMLSRMGIETPAEYRTALREFLALQKAPEQESRVKQLERAMIGRRNDGLDFFPTSPAVIEDMLAAAEIEEGMSVLEPSAGMGHIADAVREQGVEPDVIELSGDRRELLEAKGHTIVGNDFLDLKEGGYDRIVMNPPFSNRRDAEHVQHAYSLLKPGGRIVAIMGEGVFFGQDKKAQAFREWLDQVNGTSEKLPEGSFNDPSLPVNTSVNARMVVIDKPVQSSGAFSRKDPQASRLPIGVGDLSRAISAITKTWRGDAPTVKVIESARSLPDEAKRGDGWETAEGWYDGQSTVYLVANNLPNTDRAQQVLAHEAFGHYGVEGVIGKDQWAQIIASVARLKANRDKLSPKIRAALDSLQRRYGDQSPSIQAREFIAIMAERDVGASIMDRVYAAVRRWLRTLGFDVKWSEADLRALVSDGMRRVEKGGKSRDAVPTFKQAGAFSRNSQAGSIVGVATSSNVAGTQEDRAAGDESRREPQGAFGRPVLVDPATLTFREFEQNNLEEVASAWPDGDYYPVSTILEADGSRTIIDGHNRTSVAMDRGHQIAVVDVTRAEYDHLVNELGFEAMDVAYAALERAGQDEASSALARQFPGASMHVSGMRALEALNEFSSQNDPSAPAGSGAFSRPEPGEIQFSDGAKESVKSWLERHGKGKLSDMKPLLLGAIPLTFLGDYAKKGMSAVQQYIDMAGRMAAYRNKLHSRYDAVAQKWLDLTTDPKLGGLLGRRENEGGRALSTLMHDTTIAGVDPTLPRSEYERDAEKVRLYDQLRRRYDALSKPLQELYVEARNSYTEQIKAMEDAIEGNLQRAIQIAVNRAERKLAAEVAEIADSDMTDDQKAEAIEEAKLAFNRAEAAAKQSGHAKVIALRQKFEGMRVEAPYFPLKRFGRYFVAVRDKQGRLLSFSKFEQMAEARKFADEHTGPNSSAFIGLDSEKDAIQGALDPQFVADVDQILAGSDIPEQVRDAIYQRYLETLPDLSVRKSFIHRKKTPGYNPDALRSFSSVMFHGSYQLSRLKYGMEMTETLDVAEEQAKVNAPVEGMALINELRRRHEWVMNPKGTVAGQVATTAAFVWFLGANPAHLFLNASQTVMLGVPILGSRYGFKAATAALTRAVADFTRGKGHTETALKGDERRAMDEFIASGLIDKSQAHDLAGVGETGVEYSAMRQRVMSKIAWFFHQSERFNREVTALAAYRLARKAGVSHEAAVDRAAREVWKVHFDYSQQSRPRYMQGDIPKALFVFRNYSVNMLYRLFRDINDSFRGESPQAKKEARKQLGALMGMFAMMAGVTGLPFFGIAMAIAGAFDDDDDPITAEMHFKQGVIELLGEDAARYVLEGVPGAAIGVDLTERIGMPNLWFRSPDRELEGRDAYYYWMEQLLGAAPGIVKNVFSGLQLINEGHVWRGTETMLPNMLKQPLRSIRYADEGGATTLDGDPIAPVDTAGQIKQLLGFTPLNVAEQYDANRDLKGADAKLLSRRQQLLNRLALAIKQQDEDTKRETLQTMREFSIKNPGYQITADTIRRSLRTRARNDLLNQGGIVMTPRLRQLQLRLASGEGTERE